MTPPPSTVGPDDFIDTLSFFYISIVDSTSTTATIEWTIPGDTLEYTILYNIALEGKTVTTDYGANSYTFIDLQPEHTYNVSVTAYIPGNDTLSALFQITTDNTLTKFTKLLPKEIQEAHGMTLTPDGGYIFVYYGFYDTTYMGNGRPSTAPINLAKIDSLGNLLWKKRFDFPYCEPGSSQIKNLADGYIIRGANYLFKVDFSGNLVWKYLTAGDGKMTFSSFTITQEGDYMIVGTQLTKPLSSFLMRISANGQFIWKQDYPVDDIYLSANDVLEIPEEHSFVVFGTKDNSSLSLWKIDADGNKVWQIVLGNPAEHGIPVLIKRVGNQIVAYATTIGDYYIKTPKIFRLSLDGNLLNTAAVDEYFFQVLLNVELTRDGGSMLITIVNENNNYYLKLFKLNAADQTEWSREYKYFGPARVIRQVADGGFVFLPFYEPAQGPFLVKTDHFGKFPVN